MSHTLNKKIRKLNIATHRDLGYFFSTLIIVYCLSGIALNHVDDWNPDFIISKTQIKLPAHFPMQNPQPEDILTLSALVGEQDYRVFDKPTFDQVKIYYKNATLHANASTQTGIYEEVKRRPVFYHANVLHRNSLKGWKWVSDIFAFLLIVISITGLFVLKGKKGIKGRGKWFILAGLLLPIVAWLMFGLK
ncbi:MAG: PepSY-associated TM helix domain-containing protein [Flavobacteriales bacterium]|nr:PepSY-associated TM helix domain-containing protein [Flavobacteriales bacterium]